MRPASPLALIGWACLAAIASCMDNANPERALPGAHTIEAIQGKGDSSPFVDQLVELTGIVTGDFQSAGNGSHGDLGGFFVQSDTVPGEGSRGLFIYDGNRPAVDVARGDRVSVRGRVREFFGETQLEPERVDIVGSGTVEPFDLTLPAGSVTSNTDGQLIADLEDYEGMLVRVDEPMTVASLKDLERFGEIRLSATLRPVQFTQINDPGAPGYMAHRRAVAAGTLRLDDGFRAQNIVPVRYAEGGVIRAGDTVQKLVGVLRYSRGSGEAGTEGWRLEPVTAPAIENSNRRPDRPTASAGLRIATFNLQNFFTDFGERCGPDGESRCRGANNETEANRQLAKIGAALSAIDADIVALQELENDNADHALTQLVAALNGSDSGREYAFVPTGPIGEDAIRVGLIYTPSSVALLGRFATLHARIDTRYDDQRNRPALAQTFRTANDVLTVVVAHLKSKGSDCDALDDPNTGDGQGNCNRTRTEAAAALAEWALDQPTEIAHDGVVILGDLNAYAREDPVRALEAQGFVNLAYERFGDGAYSYIFDGQIGTLDYALAGPGLTGKVSATQIWHINADESRLYDYNLEFDRDPALFDPASPYRSSDHDPVIVDIDVRR